MFKKPAIIITVIALIAAAGGGAYFALDSINRANKLNEYNEIVEKVKTTYANAVEGNDTYGKSIETYISDYSYVSTTHFDSLKAVINGPSEIIDAETKSSSEKLLKEQQTAIEAMEQDAVKTQEVKVEKLKAIKEGEVDPKALEKAQATLTDAEKLEDEINGKLDEISSKKKSLEAIVIDSHDVFLDAGEALVAKKDEVIAKLDKDGDALKAANTGVGEIAALIKTGFEDADYEDFVKFEETVASTLKSVNKAKGTPDANETTEGGESDSGAATEHANGSSSAPSNGAVNNGSAPAGGGTVHNPGGAGSAPAPGGAAPAPQPVAPQPQPPVAPQPVAPTTPPSGGNCFVPPDDSWMATGGTANGCPIYIPKDNSNTGGW